MKMNSLPKPLLQKIAVTVVAVFALSLIVTWVILNRTSERDAYASMEGLFHDVRGEIAQRVNHKLIRQTMIARDSYHELLKDPRWTNEVWQTAQLNKLIKFLQVDEIFVANAEGVVTAATVKLPGPPFDFRREQRLAREGHAESEQAAEFCCLLDGQTEYAQPLRRTSDGRGRHKYVGVWLPEGGFIQLGCTEATLRKLTRTSLTGFTRYRHIGNGGRVVVTTQKRLIVSDSAESGLEGALWTTPGSDMFWRQQEIEGFNVYVLIPRATAAVARNRVVVSTALLNGSALILVAILVGFLISVFVRERIRAQQAKDLALASEIQTSALPSRFPPFPDELAFDVYASMLTAKDVGGDFYDFYFIGTGRIAFLIADVSGKGVPAALFMMRAKTVLKGYLQMGKPLAEAVSEANTTLCEGNQSLMFVTVWIGVLDTATGKVTYVNAGHNPPLVVRNGKAAYERALSGPVLGVMEGIPYKPHELQLAPSDSIYLYTDGMTEQPDEQDVEFGEERLLKTVERFGHQKPLLEAAQTAVKAFAGAREQADDCTQLEIVYRGAPRSVHFDYKPTMEDLAQATADLEGALQDVPMKEQMQLMVAADEIFANIVHHSHANTWSLDVIHMANPEGVRLVFSDDGRPFDPLAIRDPDTTLSAQERNIGGLGLFIVKKTMSPVTYQRRDGHNVLTMGKSIGC